MKPDAIDQILRETDAEQRSGSVLEAQQLAQRVLQLSQRRRARRLVGSVTVALGIFIVCGLAWMSHETPVPQRPLVVQRSISNPEAELKTIRGEIAVREARVARLLAVERRARDAARLSIVLQRPSVEDVAERAASALLFQADRVPRDAGQTEPAIQGWRRVIDRFPQTASAELARKRISEVGKEG